MVTLQLGRSREGGSPTFFRASLLAVLVGVGLIGLALYVYASTCLPGNAPPCPPGCTTPALYCVRAWTPLVLTLLVVGAGALAAGAAALVSRPWARGTRGSTGRSGAP